MKKPKVPVVKKMYFVVKTKSGRYDVLNELQYEKKLMYG